MNNNQTLQNLEKCWIYYAQRWMKGIVASESHVLILKHYWGNTVKPATRTFKPCPHVLLEGNCWKEGNAPKKWLNGTQTNHNHAFHVVPGTDCLKRKSVPFVVCRDWIKQMNNDAYVKNKFDMVDIQSFLVVYGF